jgi:hypothetical protein
MWNIDIPGLSSVSVRWGERAGSTLGTTVSGVEAFESFVAVALESEGFVVSGAIKVPVAQVTKKTAYEEVQTHGFEVDLVGARADRLVLATVKSFFGSKGVYADHVTGVTPNAAARKLYRLLNDVEVRTAVIDGAAARFAYLSAQVRLRLYVGRFAGPTKGTHEAAIRQWCAAQLAGGGPIEVFGVKEVIASVQKAAVSKTYRDNPVLVTMKVLEAGGLLTLQLPSDIGVHDDGSLDEFL